MGTFKLKLKRKISGVKRRKLQRDQELHSAMLRYREMYKDDPELVKHYTSKNIAHFDHYEGNGIYDRNKPVRRHVENPNLYEGEVFMGGGTLRRPRKCRKSAWKRYKKIEDQRTRRIRGLVADEKAMLTPMAKKILNKK